MCFAMPRIEIDRADPQARPLSYLGFLRFDGHSPSGVTPRTEGCSSWRPWGGSSRVAAGSFTPEFKAGIVERCRAGDRTIGQVAKDFDLTETAVRAWVNQVETDAGQRPGLSSDERAELARLRRENRSLREDVEVLKRATAFFAKETR
jgi:transposase